jgi:predicted nucleic acid-binding protein
LQLGRQDVADDYEVLLGYFPNFELEPISREILLEAAALRVRQRLPTPDAIQIATGLRTGATLAVTNDEGWRNFPLIETIILSDLID